MYCPNCGNEVAEHAVVCVKCGGALPSKNAAPQVVPGSVSAKSKVAYVLLGVFLGSLGIHNFYAGYTTRGLIQLLITVLTCGIGSLPVWIWAIVEICTVNQDAKGQAFTS